MDTQYLDSARRPARRRWNHAFTLGALAVALGGCVATAPLSLSPPAGVPAAMPAPSIAAGDSWTYRVRDAFTGLPREDQRHEVTRVGGDRIEVAGTVERGDGTQVYDREWNWLRRPATYLQTFEYSPAYQAFSFPLTAGKTWRAAATATDPGTGRRFPVRIEGKVLGWERVRVPAGEFDALKVYRLVYLDYFESQVRGQSIIHEYEWYAPAVKWAVKREFWAQYLSYLADSTTDSGFVRVRTRRRRGLAPGSGASPPTKAQERSAPRARTGRAATAPAAWRAPRSTTAGTSSPCWRCSRRRSRRSATLWRISGSFLVARSSFPPCAV
jgi:hypothetical protein